jgi:hypothetical protein
MMSADVVYVFIVINYDTSIIILAEIALALMKIIWNNHLLWHSLKFISKRIIRLSNYFHQLFNKEASSSTSSSAVDWTEYHEIDIFFLSLNIGLNNLIYPVLSILIISSNCFYNALFQAAPITTSYTSVVYAYSTATNSITLSSSYKPPFTYGYQCSSVVYAYYCPVFILMLIFEAYLFPLISLGWKAYLSDLNGKAVVGDDYLDERSAGRTVSKIELTSVDVVHPNQSSSAQLSSEGNPSGKSFLSRQSSSIVDLVLTFLDDRRILFQQQQEQETKITPSSSQKVHGKKKLFNKYHCVVRLNSYFLILVAYGAVFPPLAFILCFAVIGRTIYEEILLGRWLSYRHEFQYDSQWIEKQLKDNCHGIMIPMKYSLLIIIPISSLLYSYLIFDSFGSKQSIVIALIPFFFFMLISIVISIVVGVLIPKRFDGTEKSARVNDVTSSSSHHSPTENPLQQF